MKLLETFVMNLERARRNSQTQVQSYTTLSAARFIRTISAFLLRTYRPVFIQNPVTPLLALRNCRDHLFRRSFIVQAEDPDTRGHVFLMRGAFVRSW